MSVALQVFTQLLAQVDEVEASAERSQTTGYDTACPILRRSGFVLAVAALDTYFHEQAIQLLGASAQHNAANAARVASYVGKDLADVSGTSGQSHIRLSLSYKTLVSPKAIDKFITAAGLQPDDCWQEAAFALGTRPDRLRLQTEVIYDRRNQIAHEGDWDPVQLDFRPMEKANLSDCVEHLRRLTLSLDPFLVIP